MLMLQLLHNLPEFDRGSHPGLGPGRQQWRESVVAYRIRRVRRFRCWPLFQQPNKWRA